jgi:hypothetical protein
LALPPPVRICELTPITRPSSSSSGPPELPGLIAASVWIAPEIEKPLGAWMVRPSAETMPLVTVPSSPNGLPMAIAGSPGLRSSEAPSSSGSSREVDRRVVAEQLGLDRLAVLAEAHAELVGAAHHVLVGDDVALVVDHEARARGALVAGAGLHEDDAGRDALLARRDVERRAGRRRRGLGRVAGAWRGWLGLVVEGARQREDPDHDADRHRSGDEEQEPAHPFIVSAPPSGWDKGGGTVPSCWGSDP